MKEAQHPAPRARCRSLFSPPSHSAHTPPQLSHFSPPKAATFPAESVTFCNLYDGGCSCKQDGIFIWTLFPVCRLGGFICWYLVLSFLIQTQLPLSHRNRDVCLPATRPLAPGAPVLHILPSCCPISRDVKIPTFCLFRAETRTVGWAERKQEHFYCIKWKNPLSYQRRAGWAGRQVRCRLRRAHSTHCSYGGGLGLLLGTEFSTGLGSPLLGMSSALGPGDDLLMFPAIEKTDRLQPSCPQDSARGGNRQQTHQPLTSR